MSRIYFISFTVSILALLLAACQETPCEGVNCQNGGTCIELSGQCECLPGYEGALCDTVSRQKYLGQYVPTYAGCFATTPNHQILVDQDPAEITALLIYDLGDYACPSGAGRVVLSANIDSTGLVIPEQSIDCGEIIYTFSGQGSISGEILTIGFTNRYDADGIERERSMYGHLGKIASDMPNYRFFFNL